jgi:glyoxylase-like metal-dependent hydrolase (beta-lactamase superfamily II)
VSFGFVSAYILARAGEAVIVDTGVSGSAPQIETGLGALGLDWSAVGHVIVTHAHPDHQGSLAEVLARAPEAMAYAGAADVPSISAPRTVTAVSDGDRVLELQIIETPGHTPGHISVLDPAGRVLLVGDALNGEGGGVVGPNPEFSDDMTAANETVVKLAELDFETILFGHGDPIEAGAADLVRELAASL